MVAPPPVTVFFQAFQLQLSCGHGGGWYSTVRHLRDQGWGVVSEKKVLVILQKSGDQG